MTAQTKKPAQKPRRKGRAPLGKVRVQFVLRPHVNDIIEERSISDGISRSEWVERLVLANEPK